MRTFRVIGFLVHEKKSGKGLFCFHICSMVFISLVMWSWLLITLKVRMKFVSNRHRYRLQIQSNVNTRSVNNKSHFVLLISGPYAGRGAGDANASPSWANYFKIMQFLPEAEFKHILLASQLGDRTFSLENDGAYGEAKASFYVLL